MIPSIHGVALLCHAYQYSKLLLVYQDDIKEIMTLEIMILDPLSLSSDTYYLRYPNSENLFNVLDWKYFPDQNDLMLIDRESRTLTLWNISKYNVTYEDNCEILKPRNCFIPQCQQILAVVDLMSHDRQIMESSNTLGLILRNESNQIEFRRGMKGKTVIIHKCAKDICILGSEPAVIYPNRLWFVLSHALGTHTRYSYWVNWDENTSGFLAMRTHASFLMDNQSLFARKNAHHYFSAEDQQKIKVHEVTLSDFRNSDFHLIFHRLYRVFFDLKPSNNHYFQIPYYIQPMMKVRKRLFSYDEEDEEFEEKPKRQKKRKFVLMKVYPPNSERTIFAKLNLKYPRMLSWFSQHQLASMITRMGTFYFESSLTKQREPKELRIKIQGKDKCEISNNHTAIQDSMLIRGMLEDFCFQSEQDCLELKLDITDAELLSIEKDNIVLEEERLLDIWVVASYLRSESLEERIASMIKDKLIKVDFKFDFFGASNIAEYLDSPYEYFPEKIKRQTKLSYINDKSFKDYSYELFTNTL
jgi:hypothetical protein